MIVIYTIRINITHTQKYYSAKKHLIKKMYGVNIKSINQKPTCLFWLHADYILV